MGFRGGLGKTLSRNLKEWEPVLSEGILVHPPQKFALMLRKMSVSLFFLFLTAHGIRAQGPAQNPIIKVKLMGEYRPRGAFRILVKEGMRVLADTTVEGNLRHIAKVRIDHPKSDGAPLIVIGESRVGGHLPNYHWGVTLEKNWRRRTIPLSFDYHRRYWLNEI